MLSPVQCVMPMKTSEPMPPAMSPGIKMSGRVGPPRPDASRMMTAPTIGDPKITETRGERSGRAQDEQQLRRRVAFCEFDGRDCNARSDRDQWRLGPEHEPESERGERRERDAGHHVRFGAAEL